MTPMVVMKLSELLFCRLYGDDRVLKPLYNCTFYKLANNKSQNALLICIHEYCNLCMQLKTYYPQELYIFSIGAEQHA